MAISGHSGEVQYESAFGRLADNDGIDYLLPRERDHADAFPVLGKYHRQLRELEFIGFGPGGDDNAIEPVQAVCKTGIEIARPRKVGQGMIGDPPHALFWSEVGG